MKIAPTTEIVLFAAQSGFSDYATKNPEGWPDNSAGQWEEFFDFCAANIPHETKFGFVSGDDHLVYALHKQHATSANPVPPENFLGEVRASGNSTLLFQTNLAEADWAFDQSTVTQGKSVTVRGSGVMISVDAEATRVELGARSGGIDRSFVMLDRSAGPQPA